MASLLPQTPGLLPKWLLLISVVSTMNTVQSFLSDKQNRRIYDLNAGQVNPLAGRLFGVWTLTSAMVRLYAAYNINSPEVYHLAFGTFVIALAHFGSEWLVFKTLRPNAVNGSSFVVASSSIVAMLMQWKHYIG